MGVPSLSWCRPLLWVGLLAGCDQVPPEAAAPPVLASVTVAEVLVQSLHDWDEFSGRLEAPQQVDIRPRVSGHVDEVSFTEGSLVTRGDLLFRLDPRPLQARVRQLEARLQQEQVNGQRARAEAERGEKLRKLQAISEELADARRTAAEEAKAAIAATLAELQAARLDLSFTEVRAPISGRVGRAEVTAGNLVDSSSTRLTTLVSTDKVYAYFDVDEQAYLKYAQLARQGQATQGRPVDMALANEEQFSHRGHLDFLDNQLGAHSGTLSARAVFDNRQQQFTPGLYVRVRVPAGERYAASLIREQAIATDQGRRYVLVAAMDDRLEYREVELGSRIGGLRVVRKGLQAGERIVVAGLQRVRAGDQVEARQEPMADAATLARLEQLAEPPPADLALHQAEARP